MSLAVAENPANDDELRASLRASHGQCVFARVAGQLIAFREPNEAELHRFADSINKGEALFGPAKDMLLSCRVHPDGPALVALIRRKPAIVTMLCPVVQDLAADGIEILGKDG